MAACGLVVRVLLCPILYPSPVLSSVIGNLALTVSDYWSTFSCNPLLHTDDHFSHTLLVDQHRLWTETTQSVFINPVQLSDSLYCSVLILLVVRAWDEKSGVGITTGIWNRRFGSGRNEEEEAKGDEEARDLGCVARGSEG